MQFYTIIYFTGNIRTIENVSSYIFSKLKVFTNYRSSKKLLINTQQLYRKLNVFVKRLLHSTMYLLGSD